MSRYIENIDVKAICTTLITQMMHPKYFDTEAAWHDAASAMAKLVSKLYWRTNRRRPIVQKCFFNFIVPNSVTRSSEFLDFGQLFKAFGNNLFPLISQHS